MNLLERLPNIVKLTVEQYLGENNVIEILKTSSIGHRYQSWYNVKGDGTNVRIPGGGLIGGHHGDWLYNRMFL